MAKPKQDKNIEIPQHILKHLLTQSELRMLKNRFAIIQHLEDGLSIRNIAKQVKVGTDTVVRVARMLERGNLKQLLNKSQTKKIKTNTPWIFGNRTEVKNN